MPVNSMTLIERLKPKLIKGALKMRDEGASYEDISHYLSTAAKMNVGRESVRYWFKRREKAEAIEIPETEQILAETPDVEVAAYYEDFQIQEIVEMEVVLPDPEPDRGPDVFQGVGHFEEPTHIHRFVSQPNGTMKCDCEQCNDLLA